MNTDHSSSLSLRLLVFLSYADQLLVKHHIDRWQTEARKMKKTTLGGTVRLSSGGQQQKQEKILQQSPLLVEFPPACCD